MYLKGLSSFRSQVLVILSTKVVYFRITYPQKSSILGGEPCVKSSLLGCSFSLVPDLLSLLQ